MQEMDDSEPLFKDLKDPEAAKHELLVSASCNLLDRMKNLVETKRVDIDQSLLVCISIVKLFSCYCG